MSSNNRDPIEGRRIRAVGLLAGRTSGLTTAPVDAEWARQMEAVRLSQSRRPASRFGRVFASRDDGEALSDADLVRRIADAEALVTQVLAAQGRDLLELRTRRLAEQLEVRPVGHDPRTCTRGCCDEDGWMGLEAAQALAVTERQVGKRLATAEGMTRFAHLQAAVEEGLVQSWTAAKLVEHLTELAALVTPQRLAEVEQAIVAWLLMRPRTVGQLNARMRRLILAARAEAGLDSPKRDSRQRRVWVGPADSSGLATLVARLPEPDALAVRAVLTALGADPVAEDDERTGEERRADLLTALVTGVPAIYGLAGDCGLLARGPGTIGAHVTVTVPVSTLTGGTEPATVPGYGPVASSTARALAGAATQCRALVCDPETGHLLGLSNLLRNHPATSGTGGTGGTSGTGHHAADGVRVHWLDDVTPAAGYAHPPVTERLVQARDVICRAPGCVRAAERCDCDHVVPWPRGQTSVANTCCLCRRHHRLKTHAPGWQTTVAADGRLVWTTPTGRQMATEPHDHRPDAMGGAFPAGTSDSDDPPPF